MRYIKGKLSLSATDLSNHLACTHLTQLEEKRADGEIEKPHRNNAFLDRIIERGLDHEKAYVDHLKRTHKGSVVELDFKDGQAKAKTLAAMKNGADVIVQGELSNDQWGGRPDLLIRVNTPSPTLGDWSYEAADTKLTRTTKAGTILQLCVYSDLLREIQGIMPINTTVVMPSEENKGFTEEHHRVEDYSAYFRMVRKKLIDDLNKDQSSYPEPVSHCDICQWWTDCDKQRREDDHLGFVAGIQSTQIKELKRQNINTLSALATSEKPLTEPPRKGTEQAYQQIHHQAKIQHRGINSGKPEIEFQEVIYPDEQQNQLRGFLRLPEPDEGDLFFDIESARHAPGGGLEYLLGYAYGDASDPGFKYIWGMNSKAEKAAFEQFIDLVTDRLTQYPGMHVYHFAPYEPVALKRLATRHATREEELDVLLRAQCFVDLYAVTRQAIIASVESYSIKCLEIFYGYVREEELTDARIAMHQLETLLETNAGELILPEHKDVVLKYNRDDCISTLALRNWLEQLRTSQIDIGIELPRPPKPTAHESKKSEHSEQTAPVYKQLTEGLTSLLVEDMTEQQKAKWLLANSLDYFRREQKNAWWEYFRLRELDDQELLKERNAVTGLQYLETIPNVGRGNVPIHRYQYIQQFVTITDGDKLVEVSSADGEPGNFNIGTVTAIDYDTCTIDIKKTRKSAEKHPDALFSHSVVEPKPMPETLLEFGKSVANTSNPDTLKTAQYDLLCRKPPRFINNKTITSLQTDSQDTVDQAYQLINNLDNSVLAIQGPPGTGKTYTGSRVIHRLAMQGKKIGITAVSHAVIANLLGSINAASKGEVVIAHQGKADHVTAPSCAVLANRGKSIKALENGSVVGATAWTWAHSELNQKLDYLFIDEAGQMSLAMALTAAQAAKNVVLLGDPQQLEQPQKATHPEGSHIAALAHLIGDRQTISDQQGLFLNTTYRMHPEICQFTSEQYYEGRLASHKPLIHQQVVGNSEHTGKQIVFVPVSHIGNQSTSEEEAEQIKQTITTLLKQPHHWIDQFQTQKPLTPEDILVVAPYNAQVALLRRMLPENVRVGTVDKFQGQEAPVVIYSLTSSSAADAPRGMSFLFNPNRFNVATSRPRCSIVVFGSPELIETECKTPEQIQWANGLCRFLEMAEDINHRNMSAAFKDSMTQFKQAI